MKVSIEYQALAPIIILLASGVLSVLVEAFIPRTFRRPIQLVLVLASIVLAFAYVVINASALVIADPASSGGQIKGLRELAASGAVAIDGPGMVVQGIILLVSFVAALLLAENSIDPQGDAFASRSSTLPGSEDERQFTAQGWLQTEIWPLFLFCVGGLLLFPVSNDFLTMFVALEVFSLPLYLIASMARRRRLLSQEAALKYFILGAFSSAFFLFGAFLIYTAYQLMREHGEEEETPEESRIVKFMRSKGASTFTIALITLGVTDLVFALDSIPAIFGITKDPYIVVTANIFALMGLRQLYFLLQGLLTRLIYLSKGLSIILAFIGVKMFFEAFHGIGIHEIAGVEVPHVTIEFSLGVIVATLLITTVASLTATRKDGSEII